MKSGIQITHHKSQAFKGFSFEFSSPWKKSSTESSEKCFDSQKLTHDGTNFTGNKFESINEVQERKLNFTDYNSTVQKRFEEANHQIQENNKEISKKITMEKLIEKFRSCKQQLHKAKREIQTFRREKVQYEEIVYNLKNENTHLSSTLQKTCSEFHQLKEIVNEQKQRNSFVPNVIDILIIGNDCGKETNQLKMENIISSQQNQTQKPSNNGDLQLIIDEMRRKIIFYEKDITEKQILNNHQFYLLERFKKQKNQLKLTQTQLVNELKFVLAKNKKLKKENEEIMNENDERVKQIMNLEEENAKFESDIKELLCKIKELQSNRAFAVLKEHQSTGSLSVESEGIQSSQNLIDNLNQICQALDRKQKVTCFEIFKSFNIQIDQRILSKYKLIKTAKIVQEKGVSCVQDFKDQLRLRDERIILLEQELKQAQRFEQELDMHFQCTKCKLSQLAKDLEKLHFEHETLKRKLEQQKTQSSAQVIKSDNLIQFALCQNISDTQSHLSLSQSHSSTILCFNDKIQL